MNANLANALAADSTHAVLADSKSAKRAQGRSHLPLEATGQQSAKSVVQADESTPTFRQALDKTLTVADILPQATPLEDNRASAQAEKPVDGAVSILGSGVVRSRKPTGSAGSADLSTDTQTHSARQGRRPVTREASPAGSKTQVKAKTQTEDAPTETDNKDPVPSRQEAAQSQGTDPGEQIGPPAAWPEASASVSVSAVEVQDSPAPTAAEPVSDQGSKASRVGRTRVAAAPSTENAAGTVAGDSTVPVDGPLRQAPQGGTATKTQQGPSTVATAADRPSADPSSTPGGPEDPDDTQSGTPEVDLQAASALTIDSAGSLSGQATARVTYAPRRTSEAAGQPQARDPAGNLRLEVSTQQRDISGDASLGVTSKTSVDSSKGQGQAMESELTVQPSDKVVSQVRADGQGLSMTAELRSQGHSLDAARDTTDAGRRTSAAGSVKVATGTDGQRSTETTQETRLSGQAADAGSANADGPGRASSVYLAGQGLTLKDHLTAAGHDGPSTPQTQVWPNAGLSVEPLTALNNATSGRIDGSAAVNPTGGDAPSIQEQVVSSIRGAVETQTHQLSVELNPPELGRVLIQFEQHDHSISGTLQVDNRATRAEIEQALPQIVQNLQDSGIQVKRLDVQLSDQYQQAFRDSSLADMYQGHSGQQDQGRAWPYAEQVGYLGDDPATSSVSTGSAGPRVAIGANGSIDLLM